MNSHVIKLLHEEEKNNIQITIHKIRGKKSNILYLIYIKSKRLQGNFQHTFLSWHSFVWSHMQSFDNQLRSTQLTLYPKALIMLHFCK